MSSLEVMLMKQAELDLPPGALKALSKVKIELTHMQFYSLEAMLLTILHRGCPNGTLEELSSFAVLYKFYDQKLRPRKFKMTGNRSSISIGMNTAFELLLALDNMILNPGSYEENIVMTINTKINSQL